MVRVRVTASARAIRATRAATAWWSAARSRGPRAGRSTTLRWRLARGCRGAPRRASATTCGQATCVSTSAPIRMTSSTGDASPPRRAYRRRRTSFVTAVGRAWTQGARSTARRRANRASTVCVRGTARACATTAMCGRAHGRETRMASCPSLASTSWASKRAATTPSITTARWRIRATRTASGLTPHVASTATGRCTTAPIATTGPRPCSTAPSAPETGSLGWNTPTRTQRRGSSRERTTSLASTVCGGPSAFGSPRQFCARTHVTARSQVACAWRLMTLTRHPIRFRYTEARACAIAYATTVSAIRAVPTIFTRKGGRASNARYLARRALSEDSAIP
mmetsp:Transcript_6099/g.24319  ORF Transcript_6099/g.24319 Transcript_6099/m.24319 type:complete len:338 (-) Transcript_6099:2278-3291(-)